MGSTEDFTTDRRFVTGMTVTPTCDGGMTLRLQTVADGGLAPGRVFLLGNDDTNKILRALLDVASVRVEPDQS